MNRSETDFLLSVRTPSYVVDKRLLRKNLELLASVQQRAGCRILLALKGFSMHSLFPVIGEYLAGTTASSLFEARLGFEKMGGEVHIYSPAFRDDEFDGILRCCSHIVFNSAAQYKRFRGRVEEFNCRSKRGVECALRINPQYSEQRNAIYDPCAPCSRLGAVAASFSNADIQGLSGLHFHTMCEQNSDTLERTLASVEAQFSRYFDKIKWINFGGGHHITRADYNVELLVKIIKEFRERYGLEVYLEPGEAVALNAGYLVTSVLDIVDNGMRSALVDTSAACHMPDVLEMPYRPHITGAAKPGEKKYTYRIGGMTCLAGDIIGDYSFDRPLMPGDKLIFTDMAHYTMVKNNMFNGVNLPSIAVIDENGIDVIREFNYQDYASRLS
ncbi:MAG: carboxynorspermidine decarboxylase [Kiritimatiellia bacterium]